MLFLLNSILVLNSYAYYFYLSLSSISNKWCRNILFVINSGHWTVLRVCTVAVDLAFIYASQHAVHAE